MQKGSVLPFILIILVLIGVVVGYLYIKQGKRSDLYSPSPTSSIKEAQPIFTNSKLGFEFSYDKELKVLEDTEEEFNKRGNGQFRKNFKGYVTYEPGIFLGAVVVLDKEESYELNPLTVWVFENAKDLSIEDWYENYWYYPFVWGDYTQRNKLVAPVSEATISGQLSKSGIVDYQPGKPRFVYLSKDQKMYLFRVIGEAGDKILGSLKFP